MPSPRMISSICPDALLVRETRWMWIAFFMPEPSLITGVYWVRNTPAWLLGIEADDINRLVLRDEGLFRFDEQFFRDGLAFRPIDVDVPFDLYRRAGEQERKRLRYVDPRCLRLRLDELLQVHIALYRQGTGTSCHFVCSVQTRKNAPCLNVLSMT